MTILRELFETECRARNLPVPSKYKLAQAGRRVYGEWKAREVLTLWWDKRRYGWVEEIRHRYSGSTQGQGVVELTRLYGERVKALRLASEAEAARVARVQGENTARREARLAALAKLGLKTLPSHVVIRNPSTGEELLRLVVERFDGEKVGLYTQADVNLAALCDDWGGNSLEVFLSLEGEQELR